MTEEITLVCENCGITFKCPKRKDDLPPPKLCDMCLMSTDEQRELRRRAITKIKSCPKPKKYPTYAAFCDGEDRNGNPVGFKSARVSKWLSENEYFKTDAKNGFLYYGNEEKGVWEPDINGIHLRKIVTQIMGDYDTKYYYNNISHTLQGLTTQDVVFNNKIIAVENGLLDLETLELRPPSLEEMPFFKFPVKYDPEAKDVDDWLTYLKISAKPEDVPLLQEWMGYCLYPSYKYHAALFLWGKGRNGKGVYDRTIQGLVGEGNHTHVSLTALDKRFALKDFYGKIYHSCSEPPTNHPFRTETFQALTGGDTIEAEFKCKNEKKLFVNLAKITIIGNKFPKVENPTVAFKDRLHFVKFSKFIEKADRVGDLEKVWLDDPEKKSALFNWALEGLQRLFVNNGVFTESKSQEETSLEFQKATDPPNAFITQMGIFDKNILTTRNDTWNAYAEYCDAEGLPIGTKSDFTKAMQGLAPKVKDGSTRINGKKERAWVGFGVKDLEQMEQMEQQFITPNKSQTVLLKEDKNGVPSVPNVPLLKKCGHCAKFRMANCDSEAWETRNGNAEPLTNWCFKPIGELEE